MKVIIEHEPEMGAVLLALDTPEGPKRVTMVSKANGGVFAYLLELYFHKNRELVGPNTLMPLIKAELSKPFEEL